MNEARLGVEICDDPQAFQRKIGMDGIDLV